MTQGQHFKKLAVSKGKDLAIILFLGVSSHIFAKCEEEIFPKRATSMVQRSAVKGIICWLNIEYRILDNNFSVKLQSNYSTHENKLVYKWHLH